eukprot:c15232_g1_i1 orf=232-525(-)
MRVSIADYPIGLLWGSMTILDNSIEEVSLLFLFRTACLLICALHNLALRCIFYVTYFSSSPIYQLWFVKDSNKYSNSTSLCCCIIDDCMHSTLHWLH